MTEPLACLNELPEDPMELRKMLKQFYYQLEKFRKGCWSEMQVRGLAASRRAKVHLISLRKLSPTQDTILYNCGDRRTACHIEHFVPWEKRGQTALYMAL